MSLNGRIETLSTKHEELDHKIAEEYKRPVADTLTLKNLKREKLRIKEELVLLKAS